MDLRSLRYFVAVVEAESITRATKALYIAQPALTAQIKNLEADLGVKLLERSHAGIKPTAAGMQLYSEAVRLLAAADALRTRIGNPSGEPEGQVTIAFPTLLAGTLLGELVIAVTRRHAKIRLFVIDGFSLAIQNAVQDGRADFGLLVNPPTNAGMRVHRVVVESMYFVGRDHDGSVRRLLRTPSARKARRGGPDADPTIRFSHAAAQPLIMQSRPYSIRRQAEEAAMAKGIRLNVVQEHDSGNVIGALSRVGAGFTFAPACSAPELVNKPSEIRARIVEPEFSRTYAVCWLAGRQLSDAARAVIKVLRSELRSTIGEGRWSARLVDQTDDQID
ncbi:MAG: LysR family transcriptional regulator [Burkholderiales bacterium]|nr:LysR family transcriptional regulator [Burkholderiales bacterium]